MVLQMTCDHHCMVTSIEAKWPGSVHDSRIFRESALCHRFEQGMVTVHCRLLYLHCFFVRSHGNNPFSCSGLFSGLLLGDRGYACQPFLMTPNLTLMQGHKTDSTWPLPKPGTDLMTFTEHPFCLPSWAQGGPRPIMQNRICLCCAP